MALKLIQGKQLSVNLSGSFTGSFSGSFEGTGSYALQALSASFSNNSTSASYALSASYAATASYAPNYLLVQDTGSMLQPYVLTSSTSSMSVASASYAQTASFALNSNSASYALSASYSVSSSYSLNSTSASYALSSSYALSASYSVSSSYASSSTSASYALSSSFSSNSISSSYAATASYAPSYLPLTGGTIDGNVTINGTASISVLNVTYESASVIYSSGSNVFGDATNDTQTLNGTVIVSGSQQITGSLSVSQGITGSLFGTATTASYLATPSLTNGSILFSNGTTIAQDNTNLYWDDTNNRLGIGNNSPQGILHISDETASDPLLFYKYSDNSFLAGGFFASKARGTSTSPTAVLSGDRILSLLARSYRTSGGNSFNPYSTGIVFYAGEDITSTSNGSYISFETTQNGTSTRTEKLRVLGNGNLLLGTTSDVAGKLQIIGDTQTGSSANGILNLSQTWNTTGTPTALKLNITDTASNASSLLMDLQVGSVSKFNLRKDGVLTTASNIYLGTTIGFAGGGSSQISAATNGKILLRDSAGTSFNQLQFGGTTSSFPSIKRNGIGFDFRLADDSSYAPITANNLIISGTTLATSNLAQGTTIAPTLVATANNDVLVGLDINSTYTTGSFTGVKPIGLRVDGINIGRGNGYNLSNLVIGSNAGQNITTGGSNVILGTSAGTNVSTAGAIVAIGANSLGLNTIGGSNIGIGQAAGYGNTSGGSNIYIGQNTAFSANGSNNIFQGSNSGRWIADGATALTSVDNSIFIGVATKALANSQTNQIVIGYASVGLGSNTTVLGNSSTITSAIYGNLLLGTTSDVAGKLQIIGDTQTGSSANGILNLSQTWNTTGAPKAILLNVTSTASSFSSRLIDTQADSVSQFYVDRIGRGYLSTSLTITGISNALVLGTISPGSSGNFISTGVNSIPPSGIVNFINNFINFAPTSGTAVFNGINFAPTINQTGGANGITRGLYIAPTLTSAFDFRAIETTQGKVILTDTTAASGSANAGSLLDLRQTWNTTGTPTALKLNVIDTASNGLSKLFDFQVGGATKLNLSKDGGLWFGILNSTSRIKGFGTNIEFGTSLKDVAGTGFLFTNIQGSINNLNSNSAGISIQAAGSLGYNPTSGTGTYSSLQIADKINQTGTANGITRGLYINPTLTSAFDFRAIELTNSSGFGIYQIGTAKNSLAGNLLLGTTIDSGYRLNISGSANITGNVIITGSISSLNQTIKGYTQYLPTSDIVPVATVGGYVYSSGSEGDLYFAQTNGTLTNTVKLRWLEGNMYSGLLNGGVIATASSTVYTVSSGSGIIVSLNGSLASDPYPSVDYISWNTLSASIAPLSASFDQSFIAIEPSGSTGKIYAQGLPYDDGQFNTLIPIGNVIHQNRTSINATATYPSVAYGYKQRSSDFIRAFGALKLSGLNTVVSGSTTGSLQITSGTAYSEGRNYTTDVNNPSYITDTGQPVSKIYRYYQSGSSWAYLTNGGAGYETIDPTQYSLNGVLTPVPGTGANREWSIQRVYYFPAGATKGIYVYYGNVTYATAIEAIANIAYENFAEAPNTAAGAILSSYLIVRNNANFTVPESYNIRPGGLFRNIGGSGGGGSAASTTLASLTDVDVLTSAPTNGQPLVYNESTLKWENASTLTADLVGSATTASFALSSSNFVVTSTLQVDGSLTDYSSVNSSLVGTNNLYTQATGSYTSAFIKYTVFNGVNSRAGEFMTVWNGALPSVSTDFSTADIGSTTDVSFTSAVVTGNIQINAETLTSGWKIKTLATFI